MAINFSFPQATPLKTGVKQQIPISLHTDLQSAPATVPVEIDWSQYGASSVNPVAIAVDLTAQASPGPTLDSIRSVYIDNSFSFVPIYLYFPGSEFIVICPANSIGMFPVLVPPGLKQAIVYAQNFQDNNLPVTTIQFMNVEVAGWVAGTGQFSPPTPVVSIALTSNQTLAAAASTVYTFANVPIGTADPARTVYIGILQRANSGAADISSVTIGGNAATLVKKLNNGNVCLAIYALNVAAGTTAAVVVNTTATFQNVQIFAYAAFNLTAPTVANNSQQSSVANPSVVLTTVTNGAAIALAMVNAGSGFSGIGNNVTFSYSGFVAGEGYQATSGANLPIQMSGSTPASLIAASFK